jgi:haloalkane dehalogenase
MIHTLLAISAWMLGVAAFAQQAPDPRAGVFSAEFPYESKFIEVDNQRLHYIDKGEGQTFVFLHGNPTSSYLWRNVMRYVEPSGRVVAVDNIGFGKSDKPDLDYTYQTHYKFIDGFIRAMDLQNIILVVHDWGSVIGLDYARQNEENVRGVVFMEAIIPPGFPMADLTALGGPEGLFAQFRAPETGKELLINQNVFVEQILGQGALTRQLSEAEIDAYRAPFVDSASRLPIYVWPNELPIAGKPARNVKTVNAVGAWLRTSRTPKLLQYASPGAIVPPAAAQWMAENYANIETQFVGYGAHYIQEDNPEAIGRGIADWYRRTFQKSGSNAGGTHQSARLTQQSSEQTDQPTEESTMSDGKVYMLNALWFNEGGAAAYAKYGEAAGPIVEALGGRRLDGFVPTQSLIVRRSDSPR